MKSEWRADPEGNVYRIDFETRTVEYRLPETPEVTDMKKFVVTVRGETYIVGARSAETAVNIFATLGKNGPSRDEITVEEIDSSATK